ncbi:MAG: hypothetical protein R3F38_07775 [Gammaproteobacteria bacterium]
MVPADQAGISWEENPALNLQKGLLVTQQTVKLFLDYVLQNPNAFIMGVRELHGASPVLRQALRKVMVDFAADMAEDIRQLNLLPMLDEAAIQDVATIVSREMFQLSMDYLGTAGAARGHPAPGGIDGHHPLFTGAVMRGYGHLLLRAYQNGSAP